MENHSEKRGRGRPKKAPGENRSVVMPIRLTEAERQEIELAAGGQPSVWIREVALAAARKRTKKQGKML